MKNSIVIGGSILVDKINSISVYPKSGELTQIKGLDKAVGGCVPNTAIDIKRIDNDINVFAMGKIGKDEEGSFVLNTLSSYGVDTGKIITTEKEKTSFTDVMSIDGGERTFFTYAGASADFGINDIDFEMFNADMLHLGYFLLLKKIDDGDGLEILKKAKEQGITTSIDLVSENSDRYKLVIPCLPYVDNLIINEIEAGKLANIEPTKDNLEKICKKLKELGVKERVIIHMPEVGVCMSNSGYTKVNSFDLPKGYIKGATGAGDAFCAGSLYGIMKDFTDKEILEFASSCAVVSLREKDAVSGLMGASAIKEFCTKFKRK